MAAVQRQARPQHPDLGTLRAYTRLTPDTLSMCDVLIGNHVLLTAELMGTANRVVVALNRLLANPEFLLEIASTQNCIVAAFRAAAFPGGESRKVQDRDGDDSDRNSHHGQPIQLVTGRN
jgi:hypothetical protein